MIVASVEENLLEDKVSNNNFKYVFCFCLFFILGGILGIILTTKYLELQDEDGNNIVKTDGSSSIDITNDKDYSATIELLKGMLDDPLFYNSNGLTSEGITNEAKLVYVYNYLINKQSFESVTKTPVTLYWNATYCDYDFQVETAGDILLYECHLQKLTFENVNNAAKTLFGIDQLDNSNGFQVNDNTKCVIEDGAYLCGKIAPVTGITGELTPKFEIQKVTKEEDGSIIIYEKGYLVDTRSNIVNPNDGYDNYYLHSSDSTAYYYELKSADNLTFKHVFKIDDNRNYYYSYSEVVK